MAQLHPRGLRRLGAGPGLGAPRHGDLTDNYGEAGAIDLFGPRLDLPAACSAHNGFSEWRIPPVTDTRTLLVGFDNATNAAPDFDQCRTLATVNNGVGLNNGEQGLPVMLCTVNGAWTALWPRLTHYD